MEDQSVRHTESSLGTVDLRELRPTLTQFAKRTGTGGIAARGAAIRSTPERNLLAVEEVRHPFFYRPNDTDKSPRDVFSRFLWRSRMLRAAVDTRCTRLFRRVGMLIFFSLYALRRPRSRPDNFQFHLVFLPAANFLSREEVRVTSTGTIHFSPSREICSRAPVANLPAIPF